MEIRDRIESARDWLMSHKQEWADIADSSELITIYWVRQFATGRVRTPLADSFLALEEYIASRNND